MKPHVKRLALALLVSIAVVSAGAAAAGGRGQSTAAPQAGPWYTPQELEALIAYSNASFAQRRALLGSARRSAVATENGLLAYDAKIGKHYQLFTSRPDGSAPQQLTDFADSDSIWAAWSPSGNRIAFERDVYRGVWVIRASIYTVNADGTGLRSLTPTGFNGRPSWSPDGRRIVFSTLRYGKRATVSVMAVNGTGVRSVMSIPLPEKTFQAMGGKQLGSPTFSPDGKRIAFIWGKKAGAAAIFTVNAGGGGLKQVTPWRKAGLADKIDWSPDGARIAFSSPAIADDPGRHISSNVFTVQPDGTGLVQLTHSSGGKVDNGLDSWSPDGKKIAFVSNRTGTYEIYVMNADGSGVAEVTRGPEAHRASWGTHP